MRGCTIECTAEGDQACGQRCARVAVSYKSQGEQHNGHSEVQIA